MASYNCTSDRYDNNGGNVYDGVEDFQRMCEACFGEPADLRQFGDEWHDDRGAVLVPVAGDEATDAGTMYDYTTGDTLRAATADELAASIEAAEFDGGAGVIEVDGRSCYVVE